MKKMDKQLYNDGSRSQMTKAMADGALSVSLFSLQADPFFFAIND